MDATSFHPEGMGASVGEFFNKISTQYDESILKTIPPYREMFEALLGYCFLDKDAPLNILELGCGTGNLSVCLREIYPHASLTLVDLSADMLAQASDKLGGSQERLTLVEGSFLDVKFPHGGFDLVVSSMALHHLKDPQKLTMYEHVYNWLKPGGLFRCADETLGVPQAVHEANLTQWESWAKENGATDDEIRFWGEHASKYDHYASLSRHFKWLAQSGFHDVDCYWRKLMWTVFGGRK